MRVLQNYQSLVEMTSNIVYVVAFGVGFKCPRKIHLNTQWGGGELPPTFWQNRRHRRQWRRAALLLVLLLAPPLLGSHLCPCNDDPTKK